MAEGNYTELRRGPLSSASRRARLGGGPGVEDLEGRLAPVAAESGRVAPAASWTDRLPLELHYRLVTVVVAGLTKPMRRLTLFHTWLWNVSEGAEINFLKVIPLLLMTPTFQLIYLLFKLIYPLNQRLLSRMGRQSALMGGHDLSQEFGGFCLDHATVPEIHDRARDLLCRIERAQDRRNTRHIDHGHLLNDE